MITGGENITPILPTLRHQQGRVLCRSVKKNTDSLVKGMILFAQGEGGGDGGERSCSKALPPVTPWSACFLLLLAQRIFSYFSRSQKYWRETHLLDPLTLDKVKQYSAHSLRVWACVMLDEAGKWPDYIKKMGD